MLQPRYDHRHTFLVSLSLLLIAIGIYNFYTNTYIELEIKKTTFNIISIIIGIYIGYKGIDIWKKRDEDTAKITEVLKKLLEVEIESKKIQNARLGLSKDKEEYLSKNERLEEELKNTAKKSQEAQKNYEKKQKELQQLQEKITTKEDELREKQQKLYDEASDSVKKLPDSFPFNGGVWGAGSIFGSLSNSEHTGTGSASPPFWTQSDTPIFGKKCLTCKRQYNSYTVVDNGQCDDCRYKKTVIYK